MDHKVSLVGVSSHPFPPSRTSPKPLIPSSTSAHPLTRALDLRQGTTSKTGAPPSPVPGGHGRACPDRCSVACQPVAQNRNDAMVCSDIGGVIICPADLGILRSMCSLIELS